MLTLLNMYLNIKKEITLIDNFNINGITKLHFFLFFNEGTSTETPGTNVNTADEKYRYYDNERRRQHLFIPSFCLTQIEYGCITF